MKQRCNTDSDGRPYSAPVNGEEPSQHSDLIVSQQMCASIEISRILIKHEVWTYSMKIRRVKRKVASKVSRRGATAVEKLRPLRTRM